MGEGSRRVMEIEDAAELRQRIQNNQDLRSWTVQGVDLTGIGKLNRCDLTDCVFIGCRFEGPEQEDLARKRGALIFPALSGLPYDPYRSSLYSVDELMAGYEQGGYTATADFSIYAHSHRAKSATGGPPIREALAQRLHDHAIDDALGEFLEAHQAKGAIGIMGGHGTKRSDPFFRKVAQLAWRLTREGYLVVTGGGPGTMEAANLGAWLAGQENIQKIDQAITILSKSDTFNGGQPEGSPGFGQAVSAYMASAREVVDGFEDGGHPAGISLAVPTWFYGHEPSNLFAAAIAKYFDNSIREEGLLAIATAGVIYAPGSAGTTQEIFQDLTQNHYATYGSRSPMVLFSSERWQAEYDLIKNFIAARDMQSVYGDMLCLLDEVEPVVDFIKGHPPRQVQRP